MFDIDPWMLPTQKENMPKVKDIVKGAVKKTAEKVRAGSNSGYSQLDDNVSDTGERLPTPKESESKASKNNFKNSKVHKIAGRGR